MGDREVFDFLKDINYDKQYFIDRGWTKKYYYDRKFGPRERTWWPLSFKNEADGNPEDQWVRWFPPGFKLQEGYENCDDTDDYPLECCARCKHPKGKWFPREFDYGCRLTEVIAGHDSTVLNGVDDICPGHSNPVFISRVAYAPHAVCDYFEPMELNYQI